MIIEKVILHKYKRFKLLNIDTVEYTPTMSNIILGTNGSGKSSLMSRLTPIPANKKDFEKGGYQETVISHNGSRFILRSDNGKYSFIMNGDELNTGGTLKIQLVLIKNHLEVSPFIMSVLQGTKKFPEMSVQDRKDWFNEISSISYDYAFDVFNKAKSRLRDLNGSIRINNAKLSDMQRSTVDKNSYDTAIKSRESIMSFQNAVRISMPTVTPINDPMPDIRSLHKKLLSINDIDASVTIDVKSLERDEINISKEIDDISTTIIEIKNSKVLDLETLTREVEDIQQEISDIKGSLPFDTDVDSIKLRNFVLAHMDKIKYFVDKYDELYLEFSQKDIDELTYKRDSLTAIINKYSQRLSTVTGEINVLEENAKKEDVECPKCKTVFKGGYDANKLNASIISRSSLKDKVSSSEKELHKINKTLDKISEFISIRNEFKIALESQPELYSFLTTGKSTMAMNMLLSLLPSIESLSSLIQRLEHTHKNLGSATRTNEDNEKALETKLAILNENLIKLSNRLIKVRSDIKVAKSNAKISSQLEEIETLLKDSVNKVDSYIESKIESMRYTAYNKMLDETTDRLNELDGIIRAYEQSNTLIENIILDIKESKLKADAVKMILDGVSPTIGLIGESLSGFVNAFLSRVNRLISDVWGYDMSISYSPEDSLTYSFPILLNGERINDDIIESSSGMQEIINLAFILSSIEVSGLSVPMYLDEFAKALDSTHRRAVVDMIKSIKNQVFIISHYNDLIYPFTSTNSNTSVSVLDSNNIETSSLNRYNDHIVMK